MRTSTAKDSRSISYAPCRFFPSLKKTFTRTLLVVLEQEGPVLAGLGRVNRLGLDGVVHLHVVDRGHLGCRIAVEVQKFVRRNEILRVRQLQCPIRLAPAGGHVTVAGKTFLLRLVHPNSVGLAEYNSTTRMNISSKCTNSSKIFWHVTLI